MFYDCVIAKESGYGINLDVPINFDVDSFTGKLTASVGLEPNAGARENLHLEAIELYQGPFLNGFYSEWCQRLRSDLELKYHIALMGLAAYRTARGDYHAAVTLLERVVAEDPYNEAAQYQLVQGYLNAKEPLLALQQLKKYAKLCREELGTDLAQGFVDCHRRILRLIQSSS